MLTPAFPGHREATRRARRIRAGRLGRWDRKPSLRVDSRAEETDGDGARIQGRSGKAARLCPSGPPISFEAAIRIHAPGCRSTIAVARHFRRATSNQKRVGGVVQAGV